jgi:hypothetical protein
VSATTDGDGVATAVLTADAAGTSTIDAVSNLKKGSATLTIENESQKPTPTADVTFEDQTVQNGTDTVTVASANLSEGGYVVIHADDNGSPGAVLGNSSYLANGTSENIEIELDQNLTANTSLIAMAHLDTDGDEVYEFAGGSLDGPYTENGSAVVDSANITVQDMTETEQLVAQYDADGDGLELSEVQTSIRDFADNELSLQDVQQLINIWANADA